MKSSPAGHTALQDATKQSPIMFKGGTQRYWRCNQTAVDMIPASAASCGAVSILYRTGQQSCRDFLTNLCLLRRTTKHAVLHTVLVSASISVGGCVRWRPFATTPQRALMHPLEIRGRHLAMTTSHGREISARAATTQTPRYRIGRTHEKENANGSAVDFEN